MNLTSLFTKIASSFSQTGIFLFCLIRLDFVGFSCFVSSHGLIKFGRLFLFCFSSLFAGFVEMDLDSVKVMENWQSKKSIESAEKKKKRKNKKSNVRNSEGEEEANGCWVKFRVMVCCVPSTSDVDSSLSVSTSTGMASSSSSGSFLSSILFCNSSSI